MFLWFIEIGYWVPRLRKHHIRLYCFIPYPSCNQAKSAVSYYFCYKIWIIIKTTYNYYELAERRSIDKAFKKTLIDDTIDLVIWTKCDQVIVSFIPSNLFINHLTTIFVTQYVITLYETRMQSSSEALWKMVIIINTFFKCNW